MSMPNNMVGQGTEDDLCQWALRAASRPYPRTCEMCGLYGPCIHSKFAGGAEAKGILKVGTRAGEVVVNLPAGITGHFRCSPEQARALAALLLVHAEAAEGKSGNERVLFVTGGK